MEQLTLNNIGINIEKDEYKGKVIKKEKTLEGTNMIAKEEIISGSKAMQLLELSRHTFDKLVKAGTIIQHVSGKKKYYCIKELREYMNTEEYKQLVVGTVDKRNRLNDLTGKDWLPETKSFFYQKGLGANHPEAQIEKLHPAPYSFQDIGHLVRFFTKAGMSVLDPFGGVGSTAKACEVDGRVCTSMNYLLNVWKQKWGKGQVNIIIL